MLSVKYIKIYCLYSRKRIKLVGCAFFSPTGIAPAILEAQTWSHFGLGENKKNRQALITLAQEHI